MFDYIPFPETIRTHRTTQHNIPTDVDLSLFIRHLGSSPENSQSGYPNFLGMLIGMPGVGVA